MKTYKIEFNDYGINYVIANNFSEAEEKFIKSGNGGGKVKIKSIVTQLETFEPLT